MRLERARLLSMRGALQRQKTLPPERKPNGSLAEWAFENT